MAKNKLANLEALQKPADEPEQSGLSSNENALNDEATLLEEARLKEVAAEQESEQLLHAEKLKAEEAEKAAHEEQTKENKANKNSQKDIKKPRRALLHKTFVLSLRMPGQTSTVTRTFSEGQMVYDPEAVALLIEHNAPIEIIG